MSLATDTEDTRHRRAGSTAFPLVVAIFIAALLCLPDQVREIYRLHAELWSSPGRQLLHPLYTLIALLALSIFLWRIARELADTSNGSLLRGTDRWSRTAVTWIPRIVATIPLAGMALGLWLSAKGRISSRRAAIGFRANCSHAAGLASNLAARGGILWASCVGCSGRGHRD